MSNSNFNEDASQIPETIEEREELAELPAYIYKSPALAYATQLLSPYYETSPWWLGHMEALRDQWMLITVAPSEFRTPHHELEHAFEQAWVSAASSPSMMPMRWAWNACVGLDKKRAASFELHQGEGLGLNKDSSHLSSLDVCCDVIPNPKEETDIPLRRVAFCTIPKDLAFLEWICSFDLESSDVKMAETMKSLSSSAWRLIARCLDWANGGPTVALIPATLLSDANSNKDRELLVREGLITQVLALPKIDCDEPEMALVRLGKQETYSKSMLSPAEHDYAHEICFIDARLESIRTGIDTTQGDDFAVLPSEWISTERIEQESWSLSLSAYSALDKNDTAPMKKLCDFVSFKRGIPKKAPKGKASFQTIYGEEAWSSKSDYPWYLGDPQDYDLNGAVCVNVAVSNAETGEIVDLGRPLTERFNEEVCFIEKLPTKDLTRYLRTGAIYKVDDDNIVVVIARSKDSFKVFSVEGGIDHYVTIPDTAFAAPLRRDPDTYAWSIEPHYLLAYLVSDAGQQKLAEVVKGAAAKQLSLAALSALEIPVPSYAAQREIAKRFERIAESVAEASRKAQHAKKNLNAICDELFRNEND